MAAPVCARTGLSVHVLMQVPFTAANLLCHGAGCPVPCTGWRLQPQRMQTFRQGQLYALTLNKDVFPAGTGVAEAVAAPEDADMQTGTIVRFDFTEQAESEDLGALKFGTVREAFGGKNAGCRFTQYFTVSIICIARWPGSRCASLLLGARELRMRPRHISAGRRLAAGST